MVFEQVYTRFNQELYRYIFSKVRDEMAAKDILQDVFVKMIEKSYQLTDQSKFKHWLYRITSNEVNNYFRQQKKHQQLENLLPVVEEPNHSLESLEHCLLEFIADMPEQEQYLVRQVELEGKSQKQLAEELNMTHSSLRSRIQRARQKLKKRLLLCCKQYLTPCDISCNEKDHCA